MTPEERDHYGVNGQTRNAALEVVITAKENALDE
jgi:hypothetical protein